MARIKPESIFLSDRSKIKMDPGFRRDDEQKSIALFWILRVLRALFFVFFV